MITFLLGRPGSGKSYYAVDKIFNNFSTSPNAVKDKKFKYDICYTNINEFNFDKVDNVFSLDFDDLKVKLTLLHNLYKKKSTDEELIEKCKEFNLHNALFVIDEAHNFFDTRDSVLVWWLSYHRHLYHEIILITQNLALIDSKYKSFSEFFYDAVSASLTFDKRYFNYRIYCSSRLTNASKAGTFKLKRNSEVFELYKSGDSVGTQNIILKVLFGSFIFLVISVSIFLYYTNSLKSANSKDTNTTNTSSQNVQKSQTAPLTNQVLNGTTSYSFLSSNNYSEYKFFVLSCSAKNCVNSSFSIPLPLLKKFILTKDIELLYLHHNSKTFFTYYLKSSSSFYSFLSQTQGAYNAFPAATMFNDTPVSTSK